MVSNYQNADCSMIKEFYRVIYYNFRQTFFPMPPNKCAIERWFNYIITILILINFNFTLYYNLLLCFIQLEMHVSTYV